MMIKYFYTIGFFITFYLSNNKNWSLLICIISPIGDSLGISRNLIRGKCGLYSEFQPILNNIIRLILFRLIWFRKHEMDWNRSENDGEICYGMMKVDLMNIFGSTIWVCDGHIVYCDFDKKKTGKPWLSFEFTQLATLALANRSGWIRFAHPSKIFIFFLTRFARSTQYAINQQMIAWLNWTFLFVHFIECNKSK